MKKSTYLFISHLFFFMFFLSSILHSQERIVKGVVTTLDSIPLINAQVKVLSSKQIVFTDSVGRFEITCLKKDKIKISARGFSTRKVKLDEKIKMAYVNLDLKPGPKNTELAVGYGHVKDTEKLSAISTIQNDKNNFSGYSNIYQLIQGRVAGVEIVGKDIRIRGINSINSPTSALIVVDGIVVDSGMLDAISPQDVKSIDFIKDGSAAIYGARGAGGVVLITTKRGGDYENE